MPLGKWGRKMGNENDKEETEAMNYSSFVTNLTINLGDNTEGRVVLYVFLFVKAHVKVTEFGYL